MAGNGNGWVLKWLVGAVWGIFILAFVSLANNVIANDKDSRARDSKIEDDLVEVQSEQNAINTQLLVTLAQIDGKFDTMAVDLNYIKKQIDK